MTEELRVIIVIALGSRRGHWTVALGIVGCQWVCFALRSDLLKQQSRRRYAANGFALSPIRAAFLDSIVRVVETG